MKKTNFEKVKELMDYTGVSTSDGFLPSLLKGYKFIRKEYDSFDCSLSDFFPCKEKEEKITDDIAGLIYACYWTAAKIGIDMDEVFDRITLDMKENFDKLQNENKD